MTRKCFFAFFRILIESCTPDCFVIRRYRSRLALWTTSRLWDPSCYTQLSSPTIVPPESKTGVTTCREYRYSLERESTRVTIYNGAQFLFKFKLYQEVIYNSIYNNNELCAYNRGKWYNDYMKKNFAGINIFSCCYSDARCSLNTFV